MGINLNRQIGEDYAKLIVLLLDSVQWLRIEFGTWIMPEAGYHSACGSLVLSRRPKKLQKLYLKLLVQDCVYFVFVI